MKRKLLVLFLAVVLLLTGCQGKSPRQYHVSHNGRTLQVNTVARTVADGDDVYSYTIEEGTTRTIMEITYPNGKTMTVYQNFETGNSAGELNAEDASRYLSEWTIYDAVQDASENAYRFHFGYFLLGLVLVGLGLFNCLDPETAICWRHIFWFKEAEPTDYAIWMTRVSGIIATVCGAILVLISFLQ